MKKRILTIIVMIICFCTTIGCNNDISTNIGNTTEKQIETTLSSSKIYYEPKTFTNLQTTKHTYGSYSKKSTFKNKYGNSTTLCAHSGCTNYIATSGDTNCCAIHSKRCYECNCYIDEDASWCVDCIYNALQ